MPGPGLPWGGGRNSLSRAQGPQPLCVASPQPPMCCVCQLGLVLPLGVLICVWRQLGGGRLVALPLLQCLMVQGRLGLAPGEGTMESHQTLLCY